MTIALVSLASFAGMSLVVFLPYWYSIPRWERKQIIEQWRWEHRA